MRLDPLANLEVNNYDYPSGVFLGRNGKDLYFTQPNQHRVVKKDLETGVIEFVAGQGGGGSGLTQMNYPLGVFAQRQGEIFVADHNNHRVMRYEAGSSSGSVVAGGNGAGSGMNQLYGPYGVFVDPHYNVYVVDHHNHRIQRWAPGAIAGVTVAGGNGAGSALNQLYYPTNMVIGPDGWMYIVDKGNHRVLKWRTGENSGMVVAGGQGSGGGLNQLSSPHDVQVDVAGSLYITDVSNHRIMRWRAGSAFGEVVTGGIGAGGALSQLSTPQGLGLTSDGNLYTADYYNHRLLRYEAMGMDTNVFAPTMAGTYSAKVFYRNGCSTQTNSIRLGQDTTHFGSDSFVVQNNFTQNSSGWNTNQRFSYLGNQALGPFANQSLSYFNQNVPPYDSAYFEFDWNIHDSWDNNEPFYVTANGQLLGAFYFCHWGTANYPQLEPMGQSGTRCSGYPTRTYRARFAAPHGVGNNVSFSINQWNAEGVCNESWSIDNFRVTAGRSVTLCQGDTVWMGSMPLVSSGLHRLNLTNQLGCDSVVQAYVQVKPRPNAINLNAQICANTTYLFGNQNLNQSGTYTRTIPSFNGCDSVINLQLLVNPIFSLETTLRLCHGETYQFNGTSLSQSGTYTATLVSQNGCDSLVTLNLLVRDSVMPTYLNQTICQGDTLNIQGQLFWQTGTYTAVLNNQLGCDSLLYLNLQVANPSFTVLYDTLSFGSYYELGNSVLNTAGVYSLLLNNISGCDSSVTLHLFVLNSPIRGILRYQNQSLTPMGNVMLNLLSGNQTVSNVTTDAQGFFDFGIHPAGNYQLRFTNPRPWGGVNATDALGISRYFTNLLSLSGLRRQVADVNLTASVNSSDALLVSKRYSLIINDFSSGDFAYSLDTFSIGQGDSVYLDLRSLCYGDVNASFNPSVTARSSWTTIADEDEILTSSGSYFVDVKTSRVIDLGAVSLNLRLPEGVEVVSVRSMSKVSDEPVVYNQIGRNLRLAWYHLMPWRLMEGDDVIRLELKGRAEGWLEMDETESELANSDGVALSGLPLTAARLRLQSSKAPLEASIFPNPASNRSSLNLILGQPSTLRVEVVDAIGRRVYQSHDPMLSAGEHRLELPMDEWSDGQYYVLVQALTGDGQVLKQSLKLQKKR
jgi:sugar lactone lactonase YvrE